MGSYASLRAELSNLTEATPVLASEPSDQLRPEDWVSRYGDALFRYASVRLRDHAAAEDMVQETLFEAFKSRAAFKAQCSEKNWLFSILRHNLLDHFRRKHVRQKHVGEEAGSDAFNPFVENGSTKGNWKPRFEPIEWRSPEHELQNQEFWRVFHSCAAKLPEAMRQALLLRELDGLSSNEICGASGITQTNLGVLLHRARLRLQRCLQTNWFQ